MSSYTQTLENIGKSADAFGDMKISKTKFSFTVKTSPDGKVKLVNPSFDEISFDLAMCIIKALSQAEKEYNSKMVL